MEEKLEEKEHFADLYPSLKAFTSFKKVVNGKKKQWKTNKYFESRFCSR